MVIESWNVILMTATYFSLHTLKMTDQSRILVCSKFLAAALELSGVEQLGCAYFKTFKNALSIKWYFYIKCRNSKENKLAPKMVQQILFSGYFSSESNGLLKYTVLES